MMCKGCYAEEDNDRCYDPYSNVPLTEKYDDICPYYEECAE